MLDTHLLPLFFGAVALLLIVPGPDMLLITAQSLSRGARYGVACAVGVLLAGLLQTALIALGLGRLMEAWPMVAMAVRLVGAAYMAWLGVKLVVGWYAARNPGEQPAVKAAQTTWVRLVLIGMANNLLNPKALLFFSLFLPQFVNPAVGSSSLQLLVLGLLLSFTAFAFNVLMSFATAFLRRFGGKSPIVHRHANGLLGMLFVLLASRLAFAKTA